MSDHLRETARAYRAALDAENAAKEAVTAARQARREAAERVVEARKPLAEAIAADARNGVRQRDILADIDNVYTRERVRQICRDAGIKVNE